MQRIFIILLATFLGGSILSASETGQTTIFMVSLDGIRPDYVERGETPTFDKLMASGAFSLNVKTVFPTVTFQMHPSIATGTKGRVHGIVGNSFYDTRTRQLYRYAGDHSLLEAEAIWTTATRQGVRTSVLDWVNAHNQQGPYAAAFFSEQYARGISDRERVDRVFETWEKDETLRLIMAYGESPDSEGHRYGPDSPEMERVIATVDSHVAYMYERSKNLWRRTAGENDSFVFILLSDHGMSTVHTLVNLGRATGVDRGDVIRLVTNANLGHIFFDDIEDKAEREARMTAVESALSQHDFIQFWRRENIPPHWQYDHPYRTGDILAVLPTGFTFSFRPEGVTMPVEDAGGPLGMHGYDPRGDPHMNTVIFFSRYPENYGGLNLGAVSTLQIHATVASLLGIEPSELAFPAPMRGVIP